MLQEASLGKLSRLLSSSMLSFCIISFCNKQSSHRIFAKEKQTEGVPLFFSKALSISAYGIAYREHHLPSLHPALFTILQTSTFVLISHLLWVFKLAFSKPYRPNFCRSPLKAQSIIFKPFSLLTASALVIPVVTFKSFPPAFSHSSSFWL